MTKYIDNKEKFSQNITFDGAESDELVDKVYVAFEGTGYINSTTSIKSVMDVDWMCSNVVGLVGEPYDLSTISEFDEATVTFKIDSTALGNTDFDDLLVLWYDETNQRFVDMDATHNSTDYTLTFTTPHFSKYLIVDCNEWYDAWSENNYPDNETILHTAITIDCSSSTEYSDPNFYRITAANSFVDVMQAADLASVVFFADGASIEQGLTNNQEALHTAINNVFSAGTTNYEAAIQQSMSALSAGHSNASEDIIIFLSDGAPTEIIDGTGVPISPENFDYSIIDDAADAGIKIYTIGLSTPPNSDGETILQEIADRTNGEYYYAATADELVAHFLTINISKKYDITTDSDEDGLPDLFETYGMPIANGQVIFTDTNDSDADDDGLTDGEEIVMHIVDNEEEVRNAYKYMYDYIPDVFISDNGGIYFEVVTDPTNEDTDGDGIVDGNEVVNVTSDSRYDNLNPLEQDTIETLFSEINENSQSTNCVYFTVQGNTIQINVNVSYYGAYNDNALDRLDSNTSFNETASIEILNRLHYPENEVKLYQLFEDGLQQRWGGEYLGDIYSFYPGLSVNVETNVIQNTSGYYITVNFQSSTGRANASFYGNQDMMKTINLTCAFTTRVKSVAYFEGSSAHEFGHILGLYDAYAEPNNGYQPVSSNEIFYNGIYGLPSGGEIMIETSSVSVNDIEMAIYSEITNERQYFVPSSYHEISPMIKQQQYYVKGNSIYSWDSTTKAFIEEDV